MKKVQPIAAEKAVLASAIKNPLDACGEAFRDVKLIQDKMKGLFAAENRHGELQVCRTAAVRLVEQFSAMIKADEELG